MAKLLRGAQAHAACLPAAAGRQKCNADTVAVPPWLPCSRHRCVHQVTDCMLPKVLIPNCCRLLMSCCSSRVGWPLHFAAPFYSLTTALAEPCASKVGKCPACCSSHTCLNPYRDVPCAAPQPAPYTFRAARVVSAALLCSSSRMTSPRQLLRAMHHQQGQSQHWMLAGRHQLGDCPSGQATGSDPF